ncbi:hypothetical protein [Burkholderia thailandensis]|uniref:Preprotein translocase subunit SecD n=2 Tax=Burkholderia thailandensis TaxID=57975 RepID=A0AAW9CQH7_BURTH|nr:hypothetical protein [Burkholderia thailandensis]ABC34940.1 conserved hypothetical protein [Burkholderia thailandensis E264]AHI67739.1 hypothetical protein BTL_3784 [Burkholderia thailandensis H0587]AHI76355.1 hypothetical protein BTQ_4287 [Burkholderia thailandensis 2002721723]AIP28923.1 hypothetical protein DR63_4778 [Burkholderia thailandensis E264]AIP65299.1 preprotein translocase subunit SecD [Burkholderia thailandensis]
MKAEAVLPDHVNRVEIAGVSIRKGTVAAFLANARVWSDAQASAQARAQAERDLLDTLPALRALGLFDVLEIRDARLRAFVDAR